MTSLERIVALGLRHRPTILSRGSYSWWKPTGMSYLFYYTKQIQNTKGGKITNTRDFG